LQEQGYRDGDLLRVPCSVQQHDARRANKVWIDALVRTSVRRITFAMASSYPYQRDFARAHAQLTNPAAR